MSFLVPRSLDMSPIDTNFGNDSYDQFELTCEGYPICLNEYTAWIADKTCAHVIQIDDNFKLTHTDDVIQKAIHEDIPKRLKNQRRLDLDIKDRKSARKKHYFFDNCDTKNLLE